MPDQGFGGFTEVMEPFQIPGIVVIRVFQLGFLERPYLIWSRRAGGRWLIEGGREREGECKRNEGWRKKGREGDRKRKGKRERAELDKHSLKQTILKKFQNFNTRQK